MSQSNSSDQRRIVPISSSRHRNSEVRATSRAPRHSHTVIAQLPSCSRSNDSANSREDPQFKTWMSKCRGLQAELEVTAVALEQLLIEVDWSKSQLEDELSELQTILQNYTSAHLRLVNYCNEHNRDTKDIFDRRQRFLVRYKYIRAQLVSAAESRERVLHDVLRGQAGDSETALKLPKVEIPTFDGSPEQWTGWFNLFESLIHNNRKMAPITKLQYLQSFLRGTPLSLVAHYSLCNDSYEPALKRITDRYDDPLNRVTRILDNLALVESTKERGQTLRKVLSAYQANATALEVLFDRNPDIDPMSQMLIHSFLSKVDRGTRQDWEREVGRRKKFATFRQFVEYQESRCSAYERATAGIPTVNQSSKPKPNEKPNLNSKSKVLAVSSQASNEKSTVKCYYCEGEHTVYRCPEFAKLTVAERRNQMRKKEWCRKCLSPKCNRKCTIACRTCKKDHNGLLHEDEPTSTNETTTSGNLNGNNLDFEYNWFINSKVWIGNLNASAEALLATVEVEVSNEDSGIRYHCRAVIDSASQSNLITVQLAKRLNLKFEASEQSLTSIQGHSILPKGKTRIQIKSKTSSFKLSCSCEIVDEIVELVPFQTFDLDGWKIPRGIRLADPNFNIANSVDLLFGLRIFWKILGSKSLSMGTGFPCLRNSKLGWIVTDDREFNDEPRSRSKRIFCNVAVDELAETIKRFWMLDTENSDDSLSSENECEKSFLEHTRRILTGSKGYFIVKLPFKMNSTKLGNSRTAALRQFFSLEGRLVKNEDLRNDYVAGMEDYILSNHMHVIDETLDEFGYYIPHHAVVKETSTSTKVRTVVNASMPTSTGLSLNDCLLVGPVIQSDLITVLMRFRTHKFVFSADITKMYRQIHLHSEHTRFQRIFWRNSPTEPLKVYEISRLAFGTASAPFLATRCLKALVDLDGTKFPKAGSVILNDFYMDDVLTGADEIQEVLEIQTQLQEILARGGFSLSKWCSNSVEILEKIPIEQQETKFPFCLTENDKVIKTLGLLWSSVNDTYQVRVEVENFEIAKSKRQILSKIATIFDPLGFLSPVTINAKLLMQRLWSTSKIKSSHSADHWDEEAPKEILSDWISFVKKLNALHELAIPRYIFHEASKHPRLELHGFADASMKAYGAVIYIRAIGEGGVSSNLFFSKSRVAPLKETTIPRLELCAAVLLTEIIEKVKCALKGILNFQLTRLWTDSQVVLHWLSSSPGRWLPFVANRVQKIQSHSGNIWDHVLSKSNPADLVSRGVEAETIKKSKLWWHGPEWLNTSQPFSDTPAFKSKPGLEISEIRKTKRTLTFFTIKKSDIFSHTSNYWKLIKMVAWISRFCFNAHFLGPVLAGPLQIREIREASKLLIRIVQRENFGSDFRTLKNEKPLDKSSPLASLYPFLDDDGLIRVGGRLNRSELDFDRQHPPVLHPKHPFTQMIIKYHHELNQHAGPQLLRSILRNQFWIICVNRAIRHCIHKCTKCIRMKAEAMSQAMASLPKNRVVPASPFSTTGVDYAGPFQVLGKGGRHQVLTKGYIAVFVCFVTKAIHLEFVSDLTTQAFLAALTRFVSRRGVPKEIWSDNGTNFVGTQALLKKEFVKFFQTNSEFILSNATKLGCQWRFIPPHAPHFGGLWEAGVKSVKGQLKYVLEKKPFSFEQWCTILTQIEACLNSRPLYPDSTDPSEISALTPGHFLVGGPLVGLPAPDLTHIPENRLRHWENVKAQAQKFWVRWRLEYLNTLQQRTKWRFKKDEVQVGEIVILKEDNAPPLHWPLGKIIEIFPGEDGLNRVVTVKTATGKFRRTITKIILLPTSVENEEE